MKPLHSTLRRLQRREGNGAQHPAQGNGGASSDAREGSGLPPYEWSAVLDHSRIPAFVHDRDLCILRCNEAYAASAGSSVSQVVGRPYWKVLPKLPAPPPPCEVDHPLEGEDAPTFVTDDGRTFAMHEAAAPYPEGNFWYCRHCLEEVTARKALEQELAHEKAVMNAILDCAPSAFFLVDADARLVRWNSYVQRRTGMADEQLRGSSVLSLVYDEDRALAEQKVFYDALVENIPGIFYVLDGEGNCLRWNSNVNRLTGLSDQDLFKSSALLTIMDEDRAMAAAKLKEAFEHGYAKTVLRMVSKGRGIRSILMTGRRFAVGGKLYVGGVGIDTTDEAAALSALEHEARTDDLTQLPNRGHFFARAADEFARCRRYGHELSVSVLDLDHFKRVNDSYGHQAGDAVLKAFAAMGQQSLRDWDFIGRMGGEEFGVLLPETDGPHALMVAERLRQAVANSSVFVAPDERVSLTVSIGIASMREDDPDVNTLFARADSALYAAKNTGRDKVGMA
jgi:diguanylate cyclase (GGDEF)-like protein/PAS domain S-box-containing protein